MCSAKVFLLGSILKFGGNPAQLRRLIQQNWFQRVDRLGKAAFLAAETKDGGESGIRKSLLRKAPDFPTSLGNLQPNSKGSPSLKAKSPPAICDFLIFTGKTEPLIKEVSTAISGRHFRSRSSPRRSGDHCHGRGRERICPFIPPFPSPAATSEVRSR